MKVWELFETYDPIKKIIIGDDYKNYDKTEIADALSRVFKSDEYNQLLEHCILVSSKRQLDQGTLAMELKGERFSYDISVTGNVRTHNYESPLSNRAQVGDPNPDLYKRYIDSINVILAKINKVSTSPSIHIKKPQNITSLSEIDLFNLTASATFEGQSLTSLEGMPKKLSGSLQVHNNKRTLSFKDCPEKIGNRLSITSSKITDLEYFPKNVKEIYFYDIPNLIDLSEITKKLISCERISLSAEIDSGLVGLLKIKKLKEVKCYHSNDNVKKVVDIINKYLNSGRNINKCISELEDAGLEEYI